MTTAQKLLFSSIGGILLLLAFALYQATPYLNAGHKIALTILIISGAAMVLYAVWR